MYLCGYQFLEFGRSRFGINLDKFFMRMKIWWYFLVVSLVFLNQLFLLIGLYLYLFYFLGTEVFWQSPYPKNRLRLNGPLKQTILTLWPNATSRLGQFIFNIIYIAKQDHTLVCLYIYLWMILVSNCPP